MTGSDARSRRCEVRALIVYCHPNPECFSSAVRDCVMSQLSAAGAEARLIDLYALGFDPRLSEAELRAYDDTGRNRDPVADHVEDLLWCDTLIFVYPTWWYGLPAMLKGWLDRVLLPGVAFHMPDGLKDDIRPGLAHVVRLAVFTTCGASRRLMLFIGAPGRKTILRGVRLLCSPRCRVSFLAHYLMDSSTAASRARHLKKVAATMDRLIGPRRLPWVPSA